MKNTDIAMIILVASISVVVSYLLGNAILGDPNDRVENISYMNKIESGIEQPDVETFNSHALNPTVEVYVGNCGPLEMWNEAKHLCVPKEGASLSEDGADGDAGADADATDSGADEETGSTDTGADSSITGDE